jgi:hypothetical protein
MNNSTTYMGYFIDNIIILKKFNFFKKLIECECIDI